MIDDAIIYRIQKSAPSYATQKKMKAKSFIHRDSASFISRFTHCCLLVDEMLVFASPPPTYKAIKPNLRYNMRIVCFTFFSKRFMKDA